MREIRPFIEEEKWMDVTGSFSSGGSIHFTPAENPCLLEEYNAEKVCYSILLINLKEI